MVHDYCYCPDFPSNFALLSNSVADSKLPVCVSKEFTESFFFASTASTYRKFVICTRGTINFSSVSSAGSKRGRVQIVSY